MNLHVGFFTKNSDSKSIYLGQDHHISHPSYRDNNGYWPQGWNDIRHNFNYLCFYAAKASGSGTNALCNIPSGGHSWQRPNTKYSYMCARDIYATGYPQFSAKLGAKNGVAAKSYTFKIVQTSANSGKFSTVMIQGCNALGSGWKPVCDHPSYCKNDNASM